MFKCRQIFKAPIESMFTCSINFEERAKWDVKINEFKEYSMTPDKSAGRVYYKFISPVKGIVADRDFYI